MRRFSYSAVFLFFFLFFFGFLASDRQVVSSHDVFASPSWKRAYPWLKQMRVRSVVPLYKRFRPPAGYRRTRLRKHSFGRWLRRLPMMPKGTPVRYYNGQTKPLQSVHAGVVAIDVGRRDLQQCADAVMRLWGEYLWSRRMFRSIGFRMLSGQSNPWWRWAAGYRRRFRRGKMGGWVRRRTPSRTYRNFRKYMWYVMAWTNTTALTRQWKRKSIAQARVGDVLLVGWKRGSPGHAVLLLDEVVNRRGDKLFLLGQSYMPAQNFHVLRAPGQSTSPWFRFPRRGDIRTPEWTFTTKELRSLPHRRQTRP